MFDLLRFCEDNSITVKLEGKNVSLGWANINCPFCEDPSEHLGYNLETGALNCWRCGSKNLYDLITLLSKTGSPPPFKIIKQYEIAGSATQAPIKKREEKKIVEVELPVNSSKLSLGYECYLTDRGFNPQRISAHWGVREGGHIGKWKWRLIIPVNDRKGKLASYLGRDITNVQEVKYKNCEGADIKDHLYGQEWVAGGECILVEGVMDAWMMGRGNAVATFGMEVSMRQVSLLSHMKRVGVLFDNEERAQEKANDLVNILITVGVEAYPIPLPDSASDPAELSEVDRDKILTDFFK